MWQNAEGGQFPAKAVPRPWPLSPEPEPVFGLLEVFFVFLGTLLAILFCGAFAIVIAHHIAVAQPRSNRWILPMIRECSCPRNWRLICWFSACSGDCSPTTTASDSSVRSPGTGPCAGAAFLAGGALLALAIQFRAHFLPAPPELPIDKMLRTPLDAWLMSAFGVLHCALC